MKKLFTLIAFLAAVLGAKAEIVVDKTVDFSTYTGFPHYVMGYVPEWVDGVMTDFGANYKYAETGYECAEGESVVGTTTTQNGVVYDKVQLSSPGWHQYFFVTGIPTELDGAYTVKALCRASEACSVNCNMQWSWDSGCNVSATVNIGTDWQEVEWEYSGINGTSCDLIMQPGTCTATIEWKNCTVTHNATPQKPVEWVDLLSKTAPVQSIYKPFSPYEYEKADQATIDGLVKAVEPTTIDGETVYAYAAPAVDKSQYTTNKDGEDVSANYAWANQLFIVSDEPMKAGTIVKISFDYKATQNAKTNTQAHGAPTHYQHWEFIGDVTFTPEWQTLEKQVTISESQAGANGCYSVAFNLNAECVDANTYYLKNIFVGKMKLEEGYFVAGANATTGLAYDYDNAVSFEDEDGYLAATIGTKGKKDTWVNQVMISTKRGNDAAFKAATIKPADAVTDSDPDEWKNISVATNAKINLPAAGVWKMLIDTEFNAISFEMLEGEEIAKPKDIKANPTHITINAVERDWKPLNDKGEQQEEGGVGTGQDWDNQFVIMGNRVLNAGEEYVIEFKYKSAKPASVGTQCGGSEPGAYIHWNAIGTLSFTEEEQTFQQTVTVPSECDGKQQSLTFNMALLKEANVYEVYDVIWKLSDNTESLISETEATCFYVKTGAGTAPEQQGTGIATISVDKATSNATYNIAGQQVAKGYKGLVIKNGAKYISK